MIATQVRWVTSVREWPALRDDWAQLYEASGTERSPFLSPGWADAWLRVFGARLRVAVAEKFGEVSGIAPLMQVGALAPTFVGIGQELADYGGFLLGAPADESADALLAAVETRLLRAPGLVSLGRVAPVTTLHDRLAHRYRAHPTLELSTLRTDVFPFLDLASIEDPRLAVARLKKRNDVRRRLRRLQETHEVQFEYDASHDPMALDDFLRLHDLRWRAKDMAASGPFVTARGRRFLSEAVALMSATGPLRLSFVRIDGLRVVGRFGYELDGTYYGAKSAFDPAFARSGPGHLAVAFLLDEALKGKFERFDFMNGEGDHKRAWTDTAVEVPYYWLHHRGLRGAMERPLTRARMSLRYRMPSSIIRPRPRRRTTAL